VQKKDLKRYNKQGSKHNLPEEEIVAMFESMEAPLLKVAL